MDVTTTRFHPDQRLALKQLIQSVTNHDGEKPLSEYKEMRLDGGLDVREQVAVGSKGELIGYGQAAWHRGTNPKPGHWAVEIVVAPAHRHLPIANRLLEALRLESGDAAMTLWARTKYVGDAARAAGWHRERELLEMGRPLPIDCVDMSFDGFTVSTFRMGVDERAWLQANNAAFAGHPENGSLTRRDLENRIAQNWFDASGFFLAWEGDELAGSCWTKVHDDGVGEIYIVGIVPGWEGRGLGRSLICRGLEYLGNTRNVTRAKLFVEADNVRAVGVYAGLGFETMRKIEAFAYLDTR